MIEREYLGVCGYGHRTYVRLRTDEEQRIAVCSACARLGLDDELAVATLKRLREAP